MNEFNFRHFLLYVLIFSVSFSVIYAEPSGSIEETDTNSPQSVDEQDFPIKVGLNEYTIEEDNEFGYDEGTYREFTIENKEELLEFRRFQEQRDLTIDDSDVTQELLDNKYDSLKSGCENNPMSCNREIFNSFENYDSSFDPTKRYSEIYSRVNTLEGREELEEEEKEELEEKKEFLRNTMSGTDFINILGEENPDEVAKIYNDCEGITGTLGCFFGDKIDGETQARRAVTEIREEVRGDKLVTQNCNEDSKTPDGQPCMTQEQYNTQLKEEVNNLNEDLVQTHCGESNIENCDVDKAEQSCQDTQNKQQCYQEVTIIESIQDETRQQEQISISGASAAIYGVTNALLNVDQRAVEASKFFGFESNFQDLPEILREDFPSQVCMYEIDGYLDDTRDTTTNDVQGETQYGCLNQESVEIDPETGEAQVVGEHPCVQVLGDIRAQRTPLTPDGTVEITYSGYVRAPPKTTIQAEVVAQYTVNGNQREDALEKINVSDGDDNSFYDIKAIPIDEEIDFSNFNDEQRITIKLKASKENGNEYLDLTSGAYKLTNGDVYKDPIRNN